MTGRTHRFVPSEPQPPDPIGYGLLAVGAVTLLVIRATIVKWPWYYTLFAALCIVGAFTLFYARAHGSYKNALESWRLLKRATPEAVPQQGTIYNIEGALSMRTNDGGWMDIGEGAGTFQIVPRPVLMPRDPGKYEGRDLTPAQQRQWLKKD